MRIVVDSRISLTAVQRGKPTVCTHRKAAVPDAFWRVCGTPPGSENGACIQRGNSGTWESHLFPCSYSRMRGPGDQRPWRGLGASTRARARKGHHERTEAGEVSGSERRAKRPEMGRVAVLGPVKKLFPALVWPLMGPASSQDGDASYSSTEDRLHDESCSASSSPRQRPFCLSRRCLQASVPRP